MTRRVNVAIALVIGLALGTWIDRAGSTEPIQARVFCRSHVLTEDSAAHVALTRYNVGSGGVIHVAYRCVPFH